MSSFYVQGAEWTKHEAKLPVASTSDCEMVTEAAVSGDDRHVQVPDMKDSKFAHELGHIIAWSNNVYLSETQLIVFEALYSVLSDPRNHELLEYFARRKLPKR